jgi:uncharacterized protein (DUF1810 family)
MAGTPKFDLDRFVTAQEPVIETALDELRAGRKRNHWMWFVFPQMLGLGISRTSELYGIVSLEEARAYLAHPVLGPRLKACTQAVMAVEGRTLREIFGSPDDAKFRSSMTLFALAAEDDGSLYRQAIDRWCDGQMDERTVKLLGLE